jgi:hypothetical protein
LFAIEPIQQAQAGLPIDFRLRYVLITPPAFLGGLYTLWFGTRAVDRFDNLSASAKTIFVATIVAATVAYAGGLILWLRSLGYPVP